jgi:hypothetical protein
MKKAGVSGGCGLEHAEDWMRGTGGKRSSGFHPPKSRKRSPADVAGDLKAKAMRLSAAEMTPSWISSQAQRCPAALHR